MTPELVFFILEYMCSIQGSIERMVCSADGVLFCIGGTEIRAYDPISLTLQDRFQLPGNTSCSTVLCWEEYLVYAFRNSPCRVEVYRFADGEFLGTVPEIPPYADRQCLLADPQGSFLWFLHWSFGEITLIGNRIVI